jgi:hypothetical protein
MNFKHIVMLHYCITSTSKHKVQCELLAQGSKNKHYFSLIDFAIPTFEA